MRHARRLRITIPAAMVGLLALFALAGVMAAGCGGSSDDSGGSAQYGGSSDSARSSTTLDEAAAPDQAAGSASAKNTGGGTAGGDIAAAVPPAASASAHYLMRNGDLSLQVARGDLMATVARITSLTNGMGGYVMSSAVGSDSGVPLPIEPMALDTTASAPEDSVTVTSAAKGNRPYATLTLRVPEQSFEAAVRRFSDLGEVLSISTTSEDVTSQYVDLQARLRHFRAVEQRLLRFLAATDNVNQMLAVQDRIDNVQLTIEQLTAQLKSLRETTSYGTLSVFVREKGGAHAAATQHTGFSGTLWTSIKALGQGARVAALVLAALLPFIVVFGAIGLAAWWVTRRVRRRRQPAQPSQPSLPA